MSLEGMGVVEIAAEDERVLASELEPGERLLWAGHPRRGIRLTGADALTIPFSLLWCGFAIFWEKSALAAEAQPFFALWGIPFVAIGLYMVIGRFFGDALRRGKISYGLTAKRLLLVSGIVTRQVKSIELSSLGELSLTERSDRSGTIMLGAPSGPNERMVLMMGPSWPGAARYLPPMLEAIEDARAVYEKIRATKAQLSAG